MHRTLSAATHYGRIDNPLLLSHYLEHTANAKPDEQQGLISLVSHTLAFYIDTKTFDAIMDSILLVVALGMFSDTTSEPVVFLYAILSLIEVLLKLATKGITDLLNPTLCDAE